jgi:hypothetical protein
MDTPSAVVETREIGLRHVKAWIDRTIGRAPVSAAEAATQASAIAAADEEAAVVRLLRRRAAAAQRTKRAPSRTRAAQHLELGPARRAGKVDR